MDSTARRTSIAKAGEKKEKSSVMASFQVPLDKVTPRCPALAAQTSSAITACLAVSAGPPRLAQSPASLILSFELNPVGP